MCIYIYIYVYMYVYIYILYLCLVKLQLSLLGCSTSCKLIPAYHKVVPSEMVGNVWYEAHC